MATINPNGESAGSRKRSVPEIGDDEQVSKASKSAASPAKGAAPSAQEGVSKKVGTKRGTHEHVEGGVETGPIEKGLVWFFYRPRVQVEEATSIDDVQRLYMLLVPGVLDPKQIRSGKDLKRLIIVGRKMLPPLTEAGKPKARVWCFVDTLSEKIEDIDKVIGEQSYDTATRGERHVSAARPCGEGTYTIIQFEDHTHFAYVLNLPEDIGEVQQEFNIAKEGSYVLSVKNPEITTTVQGNVAPGLQGRQKAQFPEELQKLFEGKRWVPIRDARLLNQPGAELLLIGASADVEEDLGEFGTELQNIKKPNLEKLAKEALKDLKLPESVPTEPLTQGTFK